MREMNLPSSEEQRERRGAGGIGACVAFLLAAFALVLVTGCGGEGQAPPEEQVSPDAAVAKVGDEPVYAREVTVHLRPAQPRVGAAVPVDPRRQALDDAIRVRLFAHEAQRLGTRAPDGPPEVQQAYLVQWLIEREVDRRGIRVESISDDDASRHYEENRELFNKIESVDLAAVTVDDPTLAESLLERAERASTEEFARLAGEFSLDEASRARGGRLTVVDSDGKDPQGNEVEAAIARAGLALRKGGQVGLARGPDGRYHVLRATKVEMKYKPWGEDLVPYLKNVMTYDRQEQALEEMEQRLREDTGIVAYNDVLNRLEVPD